MRILYVFRSLAVWGGIERVLVDKMNFLSAHGYDVYMLTTCQGNHPIPFHLEEQIHIEDMAIQFHFQYRYRGLRRLWEDYRRTMNFERQLASRLAEIQPELIVCTTTDPVYSIVKVKGDIPLVVEAHNICSRVFGETGPHQRIIAWRLKKGLKGASCLVALTNSDAEEWKKLMIPVKAIPDVVHLNTGGISSLQNKRVAWVGRFDYQKRPDEAVRIWQMIQSRFPDWELHLYGEGSMTDEVEKSVSLYKLKIFIHKPQSDIFNVYRTCSILMVTSLFEPFGLVIPEAMSCGLPVVSYDSPFGPSFIINNGKNGFLIDYDNRDSFVYHLSLLMSDVSLRQRIGENALECSKRFSEDFIMPQWISLFSELTGLQ